MKKIKVGAVLLLVFLGAGGIFFLYRQKQADVKLRPQKNTAAQTGKKALSRPKHEAWQKTLEKTVKQCRADTAVYVDFLDGSEPVVLHNHRMRSASMIKVFIMEEAFEENAAGQLSWDEKIVLQNAMKVGGSGSLNGWENGSALSLHTLLTKMIAESDNTATNILMDRLGMQTINRSIQQHGYTDTVLRRKMMDEAAVRQGKENMTSVSDLGRFFSALYAGNCVNPRADAQMREILFTQEDRECLPAALPDCRIAHKTGELDGLYHDGGIIYSPHGNFVLVLMTDRQDNRAETLEFMRRIAQMAEKVKSTL